MPYRIETVPTESDEPPEFFGKAFQPGDVVERFSHLVLETSDLDRSEAWYRDIIGLDVLGRNLTNEERPHSVLRMNTGQLLILVERESVVVPRPGSVGLHHGFILTPSQMRRAMDRLRDLGIEMLCDREITRGDYSIELYDPDGHHVQIETLDPVQATEVIFPGVGVVDCGPVDSYQVGDVKLFKDGEFFLVRVPEGFLALSRWCRHFNGRVIWRQEHWHFYCPFHHATYDRCGAPTVLTRWSGRFRNLPALRLNPISFSADGHVLVDTDRVIDRATYEPAQASPAP
ncbi:MAG TPA: VOC family protein [Chloroflexota bacterium]|nr:VOC family protein [Chloroflexota bacterium]